MQALNRFAALLSFAPFHGPIESGLRARMDDHRRWVPEVQKATRENLRYGATQIKIMGSGSITGAHDPLDVTEFTLEEMKAIVKEAEKWSTYATVHAYTDLSIQNAINAGVRSVEHGLFASEKTMQMMKKHDVIFCTQFLSYSKKPEDNLKLIMKDGKIYKNTIE